VVVAKLEGQHQTVRELVTDLGKTGEVVYQIATEVEEVRDIVKGCV
jgi:hypothetical protein